MLGRQSKSYTVNGWTVRINRVGGQYAAFAYAPGANVAEGPFVGSSEAAALAAAESFIASQ